MGGMEGPPPAAPAMGGIPPSAPGPASPSASLPRLLFGIEESLDTLARALPPEVAPQLDEVKTQLREVVAGALSGSMGQAPSVPATAGAGPY